MELLEKLYKLIQLYKRGELGGEKMPEDSRPNLNKSSNENCIYLTLPMALNYQRNSYKLWESALLTYEDSECKDVFSPSQVVNMDINTLKEKLTKYKLVLQPNKQTEIWLKLCKTFNKYFNGIILDLFKQNDYDIAKIKEFILANKKDFPYLSGSKILNYWLYVMTQYTDINFKNRKEITIAPDTHVLQVSIKLGVINNEDLSKSNIRDIVSEKWKEILSGSDIEPIDLHTPFWLWSRNGFKIKI